MQATQLWQAALNDLQERLPKNQFDMMLRSTVIVSFEDNHATVAASNTFITGTLQKRYAKQVEKSLSDYVGQPVTVTFTVRTAEIEARLRAATTGTSADDADVTPDDTGDAEAPARIDADAAEPARRPSPRTTARGRGTVSRTARGPSPHERDTARPARDTDRPARDSGVQRHQATLSASPAHGLNPRYTYDTYVVGSSNHFAHAASQAVADQPGVKYNPFYVYGGVGLGKTHLMQAIGHKVLEQNPNVVIRYVTSERFTNDLINILRGRGDMEEFRSRYRLIDILMIDDVQFIAGKEATMEEFFHTFNALREDGKQVIITSDKPPKAIGGLEERLRSRFEGGLMADVQAPDYEMRIAILRTKSEEQGMAVPDDVMEYVAAKDQTNSRELEGAFNKIVALAELTNRPVTLELAMESLTDAAMTSRRLQLSANTILDTVASHYKVTVPAMMGKTRTRDIVIPRQVAMYLIRNETSASLVEIGQSLGGKDHTTVMHGISKVEKELATDSALRSQLMAIREALFTAGR